MGNSAAAFSSSPFLVKADLVKPLTLNGQPVALTGAGRFSAPLALAAGANPIHLVAQTALGQQASLDGLVLRTTQDPQPGTAPSIQLDWPRDGFAASTPTLAVQGRVNLASLQVKVAGQEVAVDPQTLQFTTSVTLTPGRNTLLAQALDGQGGSAQATLTGTYLPAGAATYAWAQPVDGARSATRTLTISGRVDQPGIVAVTCAGVPMTLSGTGSSGQFTGQVDLPIRGSNSLLLEVQTLAGETRSERRTVVFEPELPRLRLVAPDSARPGETIPIQVSPESGTTLVKAELTWNGRYLTTVSAPFSATSAQVPADAVVGSRLNLEALGTDALGGTVTARSYVTVYGSGALLLEAYDDRLGLPLTDGTATAAVEGGASQLLDSHGRVALATALPKDWVRVSKPGFTPVWRSAALQVAGVQALVDARLTALAPVQTVTATGSTSHWGQSLALTLPAGAVTAASPLSATPLSAQGLPGLLPIGWSAMSAWWLDLGGNALAAPASAALSLPPATPALPVDARFSWVHWDEPSHAWVALAVGLSANDLAQLSLPATGGYALVLGDPGASAPPAAQPQVELPAFTGPAWRDGMAASGSVDPALLSTVEAIHGARATAQCTLAFQGQTPVPSGTLLQADVLESYTLLDSAVIEPDGFSQDVVACRWLLEVVEGQPVLTSTADALGLRLPLHMSRAFGETELVEGRILVGFYHDGTQLTEDSSELIGANGGRVSRSGISVTFPAGALSGTTLVRIQADPGDPAALWPELAGKGTLKQSFQIDIVGQPQAGLGLALDSLDVPTGQVPLLLQRRVVQGQRVVVAVGSLVAQGTGWSLAPAPGGNPLMDGGGFVVLIPGQAWDWISGTALLPAAVAQPLVQSLGLRAKLAVPMASDSITQTGDQAVADVLVDSGYLQASSGITGAFAVPALTPADPASPISVQGSRWDLGVRGQFAAQVPSAGNTLRLSTVPFQVVAVTPETSAAIPQGTVFTVVTPGPIDSTSLDKVVLYAEQWIAPSVQAQMSVVKTKTKKTKTSKSAPQAKHALTGEPGSTLQLVAVAAQRSLSQDGRTLFLTPAKSLDLDTVYHVVADGLRSLAGETAPRLDVRFQTAAAPAAPTVDFTRVVMTYPDAEHNVAITFPEGAVPAGTAVEVSALGMGSVGSGTIPAHGPLEFTLRANLGERMPIHAQLPSGAVVDGFLSRYEATDGSGRVTLNVEGGRVQAADGRAAATFPAGALEAPVEMSVVFRQDAPVELDPALAARGAIVGRVQVLSAQTDVTLLKRPVLEFLAPANPSKAQHTDGLGAYAVFDRVAGFEADGSPCVYFQLSDTAAVAGTMLKSMGGLPETPSVPMDSGVQQAPMQLDNAMGRGRAVAASATAAPTASARLATAADSGVVAVQADMADGFMGALLDAFAIDTGPHYIAGFANIVIEGQESKPAIGTLVSFHEPSTLKSTIAGLMVSVTAGSQASYLMASFLTDELVRGGGEIRGVDPNFGVQASVGSTLQGPGGVFGTYYRADTIRLYIAGSNLVDHTAPWAELRFEGQNVLSDQNASVGQEVYATVNAYDAKDKVKLVVKLAVDGNPIESANYAFSKSSGAGKWKVRLEQRKAVATSPKEPLPVGVHVVEATVADKSGNQAVLRRELHVMDFGNPPAGDGSQSPHFELVGTSVPVDPGAMIQVKFTEPVMGVDGTSLSLEWLDPATSAWSQVSGVTLVGPAGKVLPKHTLATVYIIPTGKLTAGGTYRVKATAAIVDLDTPAKQCLQAPKTFTVIQVKDLGSFPVSGGPIVKLASLGGRVFAATSHQITLLRVTKSLPAVTFGATNAAGGDFLGQEIVGMGVFQQVPINGLPVDLLLVTTAPKVGDPNHQGVLWGFNACSGLTTPKLIFGVSLGLGSSGYAPTLDCRDGMIVVGRLSASVLLIDANIATKWNGSVVSCIQPGGNNQTAIVQPFYLADPDGSSMGTNWGVGFTPDIVPSEISAFNVVVGFDEPRAQWRGIPMSGLPSARYPYSPGRKDGLNIKYFPSAPFEADSESKKGFDNAPAADCHAVPGPVNGALIGGPSGNWSATRVAVWPRAAVEDDQGTIRTTNLILAVSSLARPLSNGKVLGGSLVVMEKQQGEQAKLIGAWPTDPPFRNSDGSTPAYEIIFASPRVDFISGLAAVGLRNITDNTIGWFVLDMKRPDKPVVIAVKKGVGLHGTLSNGVLSCASINNKEIQVARIVKGDDDIDDGVCDIPSVEVHVTFEKPPVDLDAKSKTYGGILFGLKKVAVSARHIKVKVSSLDDETKVYTEYTNNEGVASFFNLPKGKYTFKILADYRWEEDGKLIAEAGVYKSNFPTDGKPPVAEDYADSLIWVAGSASDPAPDPNEAFEFAGGIQKIYRLIGAENETHMRFSGPFNILMNYDMTMKFIYKEDSSSVPAARMNFGWIPDDLKRATHAKCIFSEGKPLLSYARISGWYEQTPTEYSDSVICHEIGHYIASILHGGLGLSLGGNHGGSWTSDYDWTLSFNEGVATFFQGAVKMQSGFPNAYSEYVYPGPAYSANKWQVVSIDEYSQMGGNGAWREWSIARALWSFHSQVYDGKFGPSLALWKRIGTAEIPNIYAWWRTAGSLGGQIGKLSSLMRQEMMLDSSDLPLEQPSGFPVSGCKETGIPIDLVSIDGIGESIAKKINLTESLHGTKWESTAYYSVNYSRIRQSPRTVDIAFSERKDLPEVQVFLHGVDLGIISPIQGPSAGVWEYKLPAGDPGPYVLRLRQELSGSGAPRTFHYQMIFN